jgi:hypothetical protein
LRDPVPVRLGNLATSLGRVARSAEDRARTETTLGALEECRRFIERIATEAPAHCQEELVLLQIDLAISSIKLMKPEFDASQRLQLSRYSRERSESVLEWSGLLDAGEAPYPRLR